ncbi:MAG: hypothetical protein ACM3YM_06870 [Sphingomonadales bacterium]|jgi:hypothetical protein
MTLAFAASLALSACATPRLYSPAELSAVGRTCRVAEGEVVQEPDEPRLLFLYTVGPTRAQLACVASWSRRHNLHLAFVDAINWKSQ